MRRGFLHKVAAVLRRRGETIAVTCVVLLVASLGIGLLVSGWQHRASPGSSAPRAAPAEPAPPPDAEIGLAGWKLSIPEQNDKGDATTIQPAALKTPWLSAAPAGGLMFWAPSRGATTKNSDHPRTELDSLNNFAAGTGPHTLAASVTLVQVPQDGGGIILGQIHGAGDISSVPYVMLRFQDGQVKVVVKQVQDGNTHINYPLLDGVELNSRFDFTISDLGNGSLAFSATHDGDTRQVVAPVPAPFKGQTVRFQAGDYQQADAPGGADDGGRVIFHRLAEQSTAPSPRG
jgi:Alginate lyase